MTAPDPTCSRCGHARSAEPDPLAALSWVSTKDNGRAQWLCASCGRDHVRDIEAKLRDEYW
ncbi:MULTISPECIES: hypothetical protein [unclassified Amycolatopsis]|uniref:hypothetical protein n=1 Tax=unclassified Amycolatopsis TaxID=2618356 RepID=UPI001C69C251|nr:hypothetical protein [Amycolatopsis sp. DSM 110486]QYN25351.1 hypothetical protein K1T34_24710 [Amycolatopsis sp. DSM 110486]